MKRDMVVVTLSADAELQRRLRDPLAAYGYRVFGAPDFEKALEDMRGRRSDEAVPDGIVIAGLASKESLGTIRAVRAVALLDKARILVVNEAIPQAQVPALLDGGADDCYVRPFLPAIYAARVRGLLRLRAKGRQDPKISFQTLCFARNLLIDLQERRVTADALPVELSRAQFDLLVCLVRSAGALVPARELAAVLGKSLLYASAAHVEREVSELRRRLGRFGQAILSGSDGYFRMSEALIADQPA